jgi:SNF2 family DNA or RNA helicase
VLVFAPRSLLRSTWESDFRKFEPTLKVRVVTASDKGGFDHPADAYVTNIDAIKWIAAKPKKFFEQFNELIIDESSAYKHPTSDRSKAMRKVAAHFKYRACMTGTPNGRSITDVWHQVFILDGGKRLGPSFYAFRNTVCEPTQVGRNKNAVNWTDKDGAEEAVFGLLQDIVIRHKFEECVDIPANHKYTLPYHLAPKHMSAYQEMAERQILLYTRKTTANATAKLLGQKPQQIGAITAVNAAVLAGKLLQLASGAAYSSDNEFHLIDDGRYKLILDLVEEREHSLVFFFWKHQRDLLAKEAEKRGISFCVLDGGVGDIERDAMVKAYQAGRYRVMFAHPKSAAHGLTLTKGTTTIWSSPTYDAEIFAQGSKRQHRMGQTQKTETITIVAPGTIDERVYEILEGKNARMQNLLDLFQHAA